MVQNERVKTTQLFEGLASGFKQMGVCKALISCFNKARR